MTHIKRMHNMHTRIRELFVDIIDACVTIDELRDDVKHDATLTIDTRSLRVFKCIERVARELSMHEHDNDDALMSYDIRATINKQSNES